MNIYLIERPKDYDDLVWDKFNGAIVAAESKDDARTIYPNGGDFRHHSPDETYIDWVRWEDIHLIKVEYIGTTDKPKGVILSDFQAG